MREQFPFLYESDCPREYLELYAKKKLSFDNYREHHKLLRSVFYDSNGDRKAVPDLPNDKVYPIAQSAVNHWFENQLIYDEFKYYQAEKKVLGVHPVFKEFLLKEKIGKMRELNADKRKRNLEHYIRRDLKKLEAIKDVNRRKKFESKIEEWQLEVALINEIHKFEK